MSVIFTGVMPGLHAKRARILKFYSGLLTDLVQVNQYHCGLWGEELSKETILD